MVTASSLQLRQDVVGAGERQARDEILAERAVPGIERVVGCDHLEETNLTGEQNEQNVDMAIGHGKLRLRVRGNGNYRPHGRPLSISKITCRWAG